MRSHIFLIFLPFLALADDKEPVVVYKDFYSEHHSVPHQDPITRPDGKIKYTNGKPECFLRRDKMPSLERRLKLGNHIRLPALDSCIKFWVCEMDGNGFEQSCQTTMLEVFDPSSSLCIYYK